MPQSIQIGSGVSLTAALSTLLILLALGAGAHAAEQRTELEEPGQVERRLVEEVAADENVNETKSDSDKKPAGTPILGSTTAENSEDSEEVVENQRNEAITILPDSEAVDESIDEEKATDSPDEGDPEKGEAVARAERKWSIRWQNAFIVERVDDPQFQFLFGGRVHNDWGVYAPNDDLDDDFGGKGTGVKFRRARLYFQGQFFRYGFFKAEYDFADGSEGTSFADVYSGLNIPGIGLIRVGHFKEPFSLDFQDSSNFLSFNERSSSFALTPGRNTGIMLNGNFLIRDSTFALAITRRTDDLGDGFSDTEDYHLTTRWTFLPYFEDGGRELFHIEVGYSHQFSDKSEGTRYAIGAANDFAPELVDTGNLAVRNVDLFNIGIAAVN